MLRTRHEVKAGRYTKPMQEALCGIAHCGDCKQVTLIMRDRVTMNRCSAFWPDEGRARGRTVGLSGRERRQRIGLDESEASFGG